MTSSAAAAAAAAVWAVGSDFFDSYSGYQGIGDSGFMPSLRGTFNFANVTLVELARAE